MGYMHIENLYKNQTILMFKECYALEKIHGTSAHIAFKDGNLSFFSGGTNYDNFVSLFNKEELSERFAGKAIPAPVVIYGEAYGGKEQGMSATYGKELKFIAFEVKIGDKWLNVPCAEAFSQNMGLEFVHYRKIKTTLEEIDEERDAGSVQAIRNGTGLHLREGVVLRPIEEFTLNNGARVVAKHKRDEFRETATPRKVIAPEQLAILVKAKDIATEWVTHERLNHVLSKSNETWDITKTGQVIALMVEDVLRESKGEIIESNEVKREISKATALLFKQRLNESLRAN